MKNIFLILLIASSVVSAQNPEDFFSPTSKISNIPQSPEASAFAKFSGEVNSYTGTPVISVPIYTFQGKEISLPITLAYDATGIRVDQIATNVGLGWNLNFGGVVTRKVNAFPDDATNNNGGPDEGFVQGSLNVTAIIDHITATGNQKIHGAHSTTPPFGFTQFYKRMEEPDTKVDYQPDTFGYTANGISGTIFIDYRSPISGTGNYEAYDLENPDFKVSVMYQGIGVYKHIDSFTVIDSNGTEYHFAQHEVSYHEHSGTEPLSPEYFAGTYVTAWYLSHMESANGLDRFEFEYGTAEYTDDETTGELQQITFTDYNNDNVYDPQQVRNLAIDKYNRDQVYLEEVAHVDVMGNISMLTTTTASRDDLPGVPRITALGIFNARGDKVLQVDLDQSYFTNGSSTAATSKRLKLDGMDFYRDTSSDAKSYSFTYDSPTDIPNRKSNGVDFWGYNNGNTGNDSQVVKLDITSPGNLPDIAGLSNEIGITINGTPGVDRFPNPQEMKKGTLTSITYPTGGTSEYFYEEHIDQNGELTGGLRLDFVRSSTNDPVPGEQKTIEKHYYYGDLHELYLTSPSLLPGEPDDMDNLPVETSGITQQSLLFNEKKNVHNFEGSEPKFFLLSSNRMVKAPYNITYSSVTEITFDTSKTAGQQFNGCTVTKYHNGTFDGMGYYADRVAPYVNVDLEFGEVEYQRVYDSSMDLLQESYSEVVTAEVPGAQWDQIGLVLYQNSGTPSNLNNFDHTGGTGGCASLSPGNNFSISHVGSQQGCGGDFFESYSYYGYVPGYTYKQRWKKQVSSKTITYEDGDALEQETTYAYYGTGHHLATDIRTVDSQGGQLKTIVRYPSDSGSLVSYSDPDGILAEMEGRNQLATPVEIVKYYTVAGQTNQLETSRQRRYFDRFYPFGYPTTLGSLTMPSRVQVSKTGVLDLEDRMVFTDYDRYGNLRSVKYPDGMLNTYIYGYHGRHLLAEIKNSAEAMSYGFIPGNLQDYVIDVSDQEANGASEQTLLTALDDWIRDKWHFRNAHVTTYTHDPGIGVTSIRDVRGRITYYEYDQHNRLVRLTDQEGKVLSENEYELRINN